MASFPRCAALLRDGTPCVRTVAAGSEFCVHHVTLVDQHGEEALRRGDYPRRRRANVNVAPLEVEAETPVVNDNGSVSPARVRPALAAAAASLNEIQHALLDAALGATREYRVTRACSDCGKKERIPVNVPDVRSRVAAIELLLREGLGRPPQAEETLVPRLPATVAEVEALGWDELRALAAIHEPDLIRIEIASADREAEKRPPRGARRVRTRAERSCRDLTPI
jgi:hypothetical protein